MRAALFAGAVVTAVVFTGGAAAQGGCANMDEVATLQIAEMQQQLMVAAYTCHEVGAYNRFVISYRPQLQRSDRDMLALFKRRDGSRGFAEYNAFKTRLANLSALDANRDGDFCPEARSTFHAVFSHRASLVRIAMERPHYARLPFSACRRVADAGDDGSAVEAGGNAWDDRDGAAPAAADRDDGSAGSEDDDRDRDSDSGRDDDGWFW